MIAVTVSCCADCPFALDEEEPWLCDATRDEHDLSRIIGRAGAPWRPPPAWCPLRAADRLVKLQIPTTKGTR